MAEYDTKTIKIQDAKNPKHEIEITAFYGPSDQEFELQTLVPGMKPCTVCKHGKIGCWHPCAEMRRYLKEEEERKAKGGPEVEDEWE